MKAGETFPKISGRRHILLDGRDTRSGYRGCVGWRDRVGGKRRYGRRLGRW